MQTKQHHSASQILDDLSPPLNAKNDAALSRALKVAPPVISKVRSGGLAIGPTMIVRILDATGMPYSELKAWLGVEVDGGIRVAK